MDFMEGIRAILTVKKSIVKKDGEFQQPDGIAIDKKENIFVVDVLNNRIQVFNPEGDFLFKFGGSGGGAGQFRMPHSIAITEQGEIYVTDHGNNRVQKFSMRPSPGSYCSACGTGLQPDMVFCPNCGKRLM